MQFDFLEKLQEIAKKTIEDSKNDINVDIKDSKLSNDEVELAKKLDAIEEYSIDRFEENIAILENRKDGKKIEINKEKLPENVHEGDIIKKINGKYILDNQKTLDEKTRIKNRMDNLWK